MKRGSLTEGNIMSGILRMFIPLLVSSLIQQLYGTMNLILIGQYAGAMATAAVGSSDLLITCLAGFFTGIAVGTNVIAAFIYGQDAKRKLKGLLYTILVTGTAVGLLLSVIGIWLAPILLQWMNTPESILPMAISYLRIYMLSMIPIILYNLCAGILRTMGDSKTPMVFQMIGGGLNIAGGIIMVAVLGRGASGLAMVTVVSQSCAAFLAVWYLCGHEKGIGLSRRGNFFDKDLLKKVLLMGIPSGIQAMVITLSNIVIRSQINMFGVDVIAAFTNYFKIENLVYMPIMALGQALISYVGQNYGANRVERMRKGIRFTIIWGIGMTAVLSLVFLLGSKGIVRLFTHEEIVIQYGIQIMMTTFPFYFLYAIYETMSCAIRGQGNSIAPMCITLCSFCLVRILLLFAALSRWNDVRGIAVVYPLSWGTAVLFLSIYNAVRLKIISLHEVCADE